MNGHALGRRAFLRTAGLASLAGLAGIGLGCNRPTRGVRFWFAYGGKNREVLERLVARYNTTSPRLPVLATYQGDYFEALAKLRTSIAAGAAPALSHVVAEVVPYLHEAGVLEPLDDYPGARDLDLHPALDQFGSFEGGNQHPLVALPFNRSTPILFANGDILRKEGVAVPTDWDELRTAASKLTLRDPSGTVRRWGFECPISWWFWVALVGQAGGKVIEADGTPSLGGEAGVAALKLWQQLVHDHKTMRPPPGRDYNAWEVTNQDYLAGRSCLIYTSTAFVSYLEQNARFPVVAAPLPGNLRRSVPTGGTFFVILRHAPPEEKRAAWEFLRWMLLAEQAAEWSASTGYLPVTRAAVRSLDQSGFFAKHPNYRVALDQLDVATPWPWTSSLFRIERECVEPLLERAVLGPEDAAATLRAARAAALEA